MRLPAVAAWGGEPSALIGWAAWTVDGLHYLADLDPGPGNMQGRRAHDWHVVDLAHARWAATSAVTAIDLCAAALARRIGVGPYKTKAGAEREFDLAQLNQSHQPALTPQARDWIDAVSTDLDYRLLEMIRHPVTHARLKRFFARGGGGSERTHLIVEVDAAMTRTEEVGDIVRIARDTATQHVEAFLGRVDGDNFGLT